MKNLGSRLIYFWGSYKTYERVVRKAEDGTYWVKWYGELVEVVQNYGDEWATNGWKTVEAY